MQRMRGLVQIGSKNCGGREAGSRLEERRGACKEIGEDGDQAAFWYTGREYEGFVGVCGVLQWTTRFSDPTVIS